MFILIQALSFDFPFALVYFFLNVCCLDCIKKKNSHKLLFKLIFFFTYMYLSIVSIIL